VPKRCRRSAPWSPVSPTRCATRCFAISATVDALEARFGPQPAYARYTETLRQEVNRLSRLMSDLLDYGRPPRLDLTDSPVGPVVTRAIAACTPLAEQTGVRLLAEVADDLPLLPLDPARMLQVLQNLIDNAIQHSPRGSQVVVRAAAVLAPNADGLELSVAMRDQESARRTWQTSSNRSSPGGAAVPALGSRSCSASSNSTVERSRARTARAAAP